MHIGQRIALRCVFGMIIAAAPLVAHARAAGVDWPRYRGPDVEGVSSETGWRTDWSAGQPSVAWKKNVGVGASTVSVVGDRLYTMGNVDNQDVVWCLNAATGKVIWRQTYDCPLSKRMFEGGTASTPTVDGDRVYTLSHEGHLRCYSAQDGKLIWAKHLPRDFDGKAPRWGYAGSPWIDDDILYVDGGGEGKSTLALRKDSGELVWAAGDDGAAYAAPVVVEIDGRRVLLTFKDKFLVALDPSNGKELWRHKWRTNYGVNATTPIVQGNEVFVSTGYNYGAALLRVTGDGVEEVWRSRDMANQLAGSVLRDGYLYGISGDAGRRGAELMCMSWKDGSVKWRHEGLGAGSLMLAGEHLIVQSEQGGSIVIAKAMPDGFTPTGRIDGLFDNRAWVMPVLSHGRIYAKSNMGDLVCLDVGK